MGMLGTTVPQNPINSPQKQNKIFPPGAGSGDTYNPQSWNITTDPYNIAVSFCSGVWI